MITHNSSVQFSSVAQSCPTLGNPMDCSTSGFPVHHRLPELAQTHVYRIGDALQPSHPLLSPSSPTFNLSQHQDLFQWVSSLHQVAKVTFSKYKRVHTTSKLDALQWLLFLLRLHSQLFFSGQQCGTAWWALCLHLQTLLLTTHLCPICYFHAGFQFLMLINSF